MNASMIALVGVAMLAVGTGCGAASMQSAQEASSSLWETRVLADGVELRVNEDASPDATRAAEDIQAEMRLRYPSMQTAQATNRWETRVLADGVELLVNKDASGSATRLADDVQNEMRSRYISAR